MKFIKLTICITLIYTINISLQAGGRLKTPCFNVVSELQTKHPFENLNFDATSLHLYTENEAMNYVNQCLQNTLNFYLNEFPLMGIPEIHAILYQNYNFITNFIKNYFQYDHAPKQNLPNILKPFNPDILKIRTPFDNLNFDATLLHSITKDTAKEYAEKCFLTALTTHDFQQNRDITLKIDHILHDDYRYILQFIENYYIGKSASNSELGIPFTTEIEMKIKHNRYDLDKIKRSLELLDFVDSSNQLWLPTSEANFKKQYKKMALRSHPDKNSGTVTPMASINDAKDFLSTIQIWQIPHLTHASNF